jgi:predicted adenine nucleotide alpha hydrolase (AANH) superfamily ATPase
METLIESGIEFSIFFYNPNIHPVKEYLIRKEENIRFAEKHNIPFIDCDYDTDNWFARAKGMENEPEKGIRCTMCFDMRFERTALYAFENGFSLISSSLGISRWKNMQQINDCGLRAAEHYPNIQYWDYNWRNMVARYVCLKSVSEKSSINKNTVAVSIHSEIAIAGV